jgi:peptide/nickel transport system permease protein
MGQFILQRFGVMVLTALALTLIVFFLTNLQPNLEKIAKFQGNARMTETEVASWLDKNGYSQPMLTRYAEWLGLAKGWTYSDDTGKITGRCIEHGQLPSEAPSRCGLLQGDWGYSIFFEAEVAGKVLGKLALTGKLMLWVMLLMIPMALVIGVLSGMREGSKVDRTLSTFSIITTATPEYVSGVIFIAVFASSAVGLKWFKGTATSAMENATFENFFLPVLTISLYGMGYISRMTRASMTEVMTAQYIRTARLKGVSFYNVVVKHALRNALIAPFTVIMLQFPWLLNGVVIVETLFNYKGFGWALVQAAGNNDIELLLAISVVSVVVVLVTQLISDIGYVYLNPRIRIS